MHLVFTFLRIVDANFASPIVLSVVRVTVDLSFEVYSKGVKVSSKMYSFVL